MAEFWRALRTLKALQAEQAAAQAAGAHVLEVPPKRPRPAAPVAPCPAPNEPERGAARRLRYVMPDQPVPARTLHEPAAPWLPDEPETGPARQAPSAPASRTNPKPHPLIGQTTAADGALASAAALLRGMPDGGRR